MFEWMAWTTPVAIFFICLGLILIGMSIWELKSPSIPRRGFIPMVTTRGDRLFIGLLASAYLNLAFIGVSGSLAVWLGLETEPSIWNSFVLSLGLLALIMLKG